MRDAAVLALLAFSRRVYVDDSMLIIDSGWQQRMIDSIRAERPPLIIIQNTALNRTEISRFRNWATRVMEHVESGYVLSESLHGTDFYLLRRGTDDPPQELHPRDRGRG